MQRSGKFSQAIGCQGKTAVVYLYLSMMKKDFEGQPVTKVDRFSAAQRAGMRPGDILLTINGEQVRDLVDYEALSACAELKLTFLREGEEQCCTIKKGEYAPLGLCFETSLMDRMQTCRNKCVFCFIDQMPKGIRSSLNVKDDDWRMSFIMGNYVSLTNVGEAEFQRILKRRVSPLYVSVHATESAVRCTMMHNPTAGTIMERLRALAEAELTFHTQVVLCPGLNDGAVLEKTLSDLKSLWPWCRSLAIVPVGLTRYRRGLYPLRGFTAEEAKVIVAWGRKVTDQCRRELGDDFCFLSDEWYTTAETELPPLEEYGDFPQLENGVGLLRFFERDFREALAERTPLPAPRRLTIAGGVAANPFFKKLYRCLEPYNVFVESIPVENRFFGGNVHVAGLVTGGDLIARFEKNCPQPLLIPRTMLREVEDVFLDGKTLSEVEQILHTRLVPFRDGFELIDILFGEPCI